MIQSALLILLGFIGATFLALLIAPVLWRRAVFLTRKRIESSVPLTANELQADKDRLRAEHAIALTKTETKQQELRDRLTVQEAETGRLGEMRKVLETTLSERDEEIKLLKRNVDEREALVSQKQAEQGALELQLDTIRADLAARGGELQTFKRMLGESEKNHAAAAESGALAISEMEKNKAELEALKEKRRADQATLREGRAQVREASQLLKNEKSKTASLEKRVEKVVRTQTDLEEKLARRDKDFAREQEKQSAAALDLSEYEALARDAQKERDVLEKELAELSLAYNKLDKRMSELMAKNADGDASEIKIAQLEADVKKLTQQRDKAAADLKASKATAKVASATSAAASSAPQSGGDQKLRDQVNQIAAEMVQLTSLLEGDSSPINDILANANENDNGGSVSLVKRIERLREKAAKAAE